MYIFIVELFNKKIVGGDWCLNVWCVGRMNESSKNKEWGF